MPDEKVKVRIVRGGAGRIDDLAPLYIALQEHHRTLAPNLAGMSARPLDDAWERRRDRYARWLVRPDAFTVIAEQGSHAVGFALVTLEEDYDGWASGARIGELRDLAVLPELRGQGIGSRLMAAVAGELAAAGVRACRLTVLACNEDARRFYARCGMATVSHVLVGGLTSRVSQPATDSAVSAD
ncbi:MAG TPA: GNAT family N-acetyltransferase [Solirubrobacteraceae bacterium]|nr:GNAT family N-acetyltransferase [Solirubrobacteraceae bacterium]